MAKRGKSESAPISLFPFLSILACVIGTLILMIAGLALGQMGAQPSDEEVRRAEEYATLNKNSAALEAQLEELRSSAAEKSSLADQLAATQAELARLRKQLALRNTTALRLEDLLQKLLAREKDLREQLAGLEKEHAELLEQIKPLEAELARRKSVPTEAVVKVAPGGSGSSAGIDALFVEADARGVAIHKDGQITRVNRNDLGKNPDYLKALDGVAKDPKGMVIFLIRDDGISTYDAARKVAQSRRAAHGKLPIVGQGTLDLSLFK